MPGFVLFCRRVCNICTNLHRFVHVYSLGLVFSKLAVCFSAWDLLQTGSVWPPGLLRALPFQALEQGWPKPLPCPVWSQGDPRSGRKVLGVGTMGEWWLPPGGGGPGAGKRSTPSISPSRDDGCSTEPLWSWWHRRWLLPAQALSRDGSLSGLS